MMFAQSSSKSSHRILVTDGNERAALAVVRSLGRAGFAPYVCAARGASLAAASRYVQGEARTVDPLEDERAYVADLGRLIEQWNIKTVMPVSEPAILAVLAAREQLGVDVPFPHLQTFQRICDKRALLEAAPGVGIAVPRQVTIHGVHEVADQLDRWQSYPTVIKPSRSVSEWNGARSKLGVSYAHSVDALRREIGALPRAAFPVLLQQRVVGPGVGIFLLVRRGEILAEFAHERIREKPPSGGVSVYRQSIPADPELVARSRALLEQFGWDGVAMVEYKVESATGIPFLMEVNGRFWGSLQLAIDAGVDFPTLLLRSVSGQSVQTPDYRAGVRSRWWWGDVDQLLLRLRHSAQDLALPPDAPSRLRSIIDFLALWRPGDRNEIFRWNDPLPFFRETMDWLWRR